jgi:hypothetical protein
MSGWGDEGGQCWDFEYQRCMGLGSFGRVDGYDQWSCEGPGADGSEKFVEGEMRRRSDVCGVCWNVEYQRCMGSGSFGQTAVRATWD